MNHIDLLKDMKDGIGTKDPIVFFEKMVDVFSLLFEKVDKLESDVANVQSTLEKVKNNSALSIQWDERLADDMLLDQIKILREDKETYHAELSAFKKASMEGVVTKTYLSFVEFWLNTLGCHPFLNYKK